MFLEIEIDMKVDPNFSNYIVYMESLNGSHRGHSSIRSIELFNCVLKGESADTNSH